ncbi:UNVERIFIED_CONTAM: hypothetical protein FKN15_004179 [Acipenser sinensis]
MMVGAFLWGGLADRIGRRQCLLISLSINSVFAFFSSFVQGYSTFLLCRLLSGVGYYGLTVWFPDMIKHMQKQDYALRTKVFVKERVEHFTFNFTLENQVHRNGEYFNDKFMNLKMKSVLFEDTLFEECYFEDITSSNTFFKNCTFVSSLFYNTGVRSLEPLEQGCPIPVLEGRCPSWFLFQLNTKLLNWTN